MREAALQLSPAWLRPQPDLRGTDLRARDRTDFGRFTSSTRSSRDGFPQRSMIVCGSFSSNQPYRHGSKGHEILQALVSDVVAFLERDLPPRVSAVMESLHAEWDRPLEPSQTAKQFGVSPQLIRREFKRALGNHAFRLSEADPNRLCARPVVGHALKDIGRRSADRILRSKPSMPCFEGTYAIVAARAETDRALPRKAAQSTEINPID